MCFLQVSTDISIQSLSKDIHVGVVITAWRRIQLENINDIMNYADLFCKFLLDFSPTYGYLLNISKEKKKQKKKKNRAIRLE